MVGESQLACYELINIIKLPKTGFIFKLKLMTSVTYFLPITDSKQLAYEMVDSRPMV
jgi:hypothetical protein